MLDSHDLRDRQIRAAIREHKDLSRKLHTLIKLDKPIQKGWRRSYVLTEHAQRRRDRPLLEAILKVIGTVVFHHSRNFRSRHGRSKKVVEIEQPLRPIPTYEWERKNYPREWWRYFHYELILQYNRHWQPSWVINQPSLFQLNTKRNWLWFFYEVDPAIATRLSELECWLESRDGRHRYDWLKGRSQGNWWNQGDWHRALQRLHLHEIKQALDFFPDVDPAASRRRGPISVRHILASHLSRRSPMQRQRAQNSSSAGASPAAGTIFQLP